MTGPFFVHHVSTHWQVETPVCGPSKARTTDPAAGPEWDEGNGVKEVSTND
jgi:hypothetical protein